MKHDLKNMQESLDNIFTIQPQILDKLNNETSSLTENNYFDETNVFYIDQDSGLDLMEDKLTMDPLFKKKVVNVY